MVEHVQAASSSVADYTGGAACHGLIDAQSPGFAAGCQSQEVDHAIENGHPALVHETEEVDARLLAELLFEFGFQGSCAGDDHVVVLSAI